MLAIK
jgi:DNA-binding transcriptional MerR regulator